MVTFGQLRSLLRGPTVRIVLVTGLLFACTAVAVPRALGQSALAATFPLAAVLALASVGETLVVQQRGIDLSVPGTMALSAYLVAAVPGRYHVPLIVAIVVVTVVSAAIGLLNGLLVTKAGITPLVATLAVGAILQGVLLSYSGASTATVSQELARFGKATVGPISLMLIVTLAATFIVGASIRTTVAGRRFIAVGASPRAGRASGFLVDRYVIGGYVGGALCYGFAGVLLVAYLGTTSATLGDPYELAVIAAVIIGGTPLTGGKGSVVATWVAALLLAELDQIVQTLGAPDAAQLLIQSAVIAVAGGLAALRIGGHTHRIFRLRSRDAVGSQAGPVP